MSYDENKKALDKALKAQAIKVNPQTTQQMIKEAMRKVKPTVQPKENAKA